MDETPMVPKQERQAMQEFQPGMETEPKGPMVAFGRMCTYFLVGVPIVFSQPRAFAQMSLAGLQTVVQQAAAGRDGQHDFDFLFGKWRVHNRRLLHPLTSSEEWVEFESTLVVQPVWGGRANRDVFEADSPSNRVEGMTVR